MVHSSGGQQTGSTGRKARTGFLLSNRSRHEPVREWLRSLPYDDDRKRIGAGIKTVEFGWPLGMPVCRPLGGGLYEVRTALSHNRITRVLFYVDRRSRMVLLHGFIKKTRKTPAEDLALARTNKRKHQQGER